MDRVILFSENAVQRWQHDPENQLFERKSARLAPKDLASHLCAFANASGGTLVIGIEDDGEITGITVSQENAFRQAGIEFLSLLPEYQVFARQVQVEDSSEPKHILVFFIQPSHNIIIKLKTGEAYLRVGDQSRRLSASQLLELEYARGTRSFETTLVPDATLEDLDENLIAEYVRLLDPMASDSTDLLQARGLLRKDGITVAGFLLFAKHPTRFLPAARVRFLRYEGTRAGVGSNFNIIKDVTLDGALPNLLREGQRLLESQMREFQQLSRDGTFVKIPEYPPFTWLEGLVNAVTHRDYSLQGDYIRISMFDDRMEIASPGALPSIVTVDNIQNTRFSRNPLIARVLGDFGWVRELNEGVKRIYQDMAAYFLDPPIYEVYNRNTVMLTLKNNIGTRAIRRLETGITDLYAVWRTLTPLEKNLVYYIANVDQCTTKKLMDFTGKSRPTVLRYIRRLSDTGIVKEHAAAVSDPTKYYTLADAYPEEP